MATTVKWVADAALRALGKVNAQGNPDESRQSKYYKLAPSVCDRLQIELLTNEGFDFDAAASFPTVNTLTDELTLSDWAARYALPLGLAAELARIDGDTQQYNTLIVLYQNAVARMPVRGDTEIADVYGVTDDYDLTGVQ